MRLGNRGNVAIITALCLPVIVGGTAYGVEVTYWRYDQVRLQQAADSAAYAAAVVDRANSDASNATLTTAATTAATSNGYNSSTDSIVINTPSTATPSDPNSVEAVITRTEPPIFTAYIRCMIANWQNSSCSNATAIVKVSSTASFSSAANACILALSPSASAAANFSGSSLLNLDGCTVMTNSLASDAFNIAGDSSLTAPCIYSAGGASVGGTLDLTTCGAVKTSQPPVADPYASLVMPTVGTPVSFDESNPVCGSTYSGMSLKNTVNLNPSGLSSCTYIVDGGDLDVNANANVTCSGCTFYLTNGSSLKMNGNSDSQITAPTSGTYAGLAIIEDRSNSSALTINGDSSSTFTGAIYAPDGPVSYLGNYSGENGCTQIVALTVSFSGNTTFSDNCSAAHIPPVTVGSVVRLSA